MKRRNKYTALGRRKQHASVEITSGFTAYEDLVRVGELASGVVKRLMESADVPLFTKVEQKTETGGGPAERAGLAKGDVIIEIAGQSITNIYDYTFALELLKIGQPAKEIYMRGTEERETSLTPAARK